MLCTVACVFCVQQLQEVNGSLVFTISIRMQESLQKHDTIEGAQSTRVLVYGNEFKLGVDVWIDRVSMVHLPLITVSHQCSQSSDSLLTVMQYHQFHYYCCYHQFQLPDGNRFQFNVLTATPTACSLVRITVCIGNEEMTSQTLHHTQLLLHNVQPLYDISEVPTFLCLQESKNYFKTIFNYHITLSALHKPKISD